MIARALALALGLLAAVPALAAEPPTTFGILYLGREAEIRLCRAPGLRRPRRLRSAGPRSRARTPRIAESRILGRALELAFELEERMLAPGEDAVGAVEAAGPKAVLLDLPLGETEAVASGPRRARRPHPLQRPPPGCGAARRGLRAGALPHHPEPGNDSPTRWRSSSPPRLAPRVDAGRRATRPASRTRTPSAPPPASSASRSCERRPFALTNDPRQRELSNVALLTGGADYDVVYVADADGEFARYVPYATYSPRPVVGAAACGRWHGTGALSAPARRSSTSASPAGRRGR